MLLRLELRCQWVQAQFVSYPVRCSLLFCFGHTVIRGIFLLQHLLYCLQLLSVLSSRRLAFWCKASICFSSTSAVSTNRAALLAVMSAMDVLDVIELAADLHLIAEFLEYTDCDFLEPVVGMTACIYTVVVVIAELPCCR